MKTIMIAILSILFISACSSETTNNGETLQSVTQTPQPKVEASEQPPQIPSLE